MSTGGLAGELFPELPPREEPSPVVFAVLVIKYEDGGTDHIVLPPHAAEAVVAAERARREAGARGGAELPFGETGPTKPCGCGPDEPCDEHADRDPALWNDDAWEAPRGAEGALG